MSFTLITKFCRRKTSWNIQGCCSALIWLTGTFSSLLPPKGPDHKHWDPLVRQGNKHSNVDTQDSPKMSILQRTTSIFEGQELFPNLESDRLSFATEKAWILCANPAKGLQKTWKILLRETKPQYFCNYTSKQVLNKLQRNFENYCSK